MTPEAAVEGEFANGLGMGRYRSEIIDTIGMNPRDAEDIVRTVYEALGDKKEIEDSDLDSDVRAVFYTLQDYDLMECRREESRTSSGALWREYYWQPTV